MIVFDFDGVLINSLKEVALTAHNAAFETQFYSLDQLDPKYLRNFTELRYAVQPAGDFLPFAEACRQQDKRDVLPTFESLRNSSTLKARTKLFFSTRRAFVSSHREQWLDLHTAYEPLFGVLKGKHQDSIVLLTNKDSKAVVDLCQYFSLRLCPENIYSGDGGRTKKENFCAIRERFQTNDYYFIDDSIKNLAQLKEKLPDVGYMLASWGYIGPTDIEDAQSLDISVFSQSDLIERFVSNMPSM